MTIYFATTNFFALMVYYSKHTHREVREKSMAYLILILLTACTTIGWIKYRVSAAALAYYIIKKGYKPPDECELRGCTEAVVKRFFRDIT